MVVLVASKISGGASRATGLLTEALISDSIPVTLINPHDLAASFCSIDQRDEKIQLIVKESVVRPRVVYMSSHWRCESIIRIPQATQYPNVFRLRVQQFMQDFRFALESIAWIPGKYEVIEKAESKPTLMRLAATHGIPVPEFTINSFSPPSQTNLFRKNLGFPFVVSLNKEKGIEVGVTNTNVPFDSSKQHSAEEPWQWQSAIKTSGQVRCFVVGDQVWSVVWRKTPGEATLQDFRQMNEVEKRETIWVPYRISPQLSKAIVSLVGDLGLTVAAPEFLLSEEGDLIFIDLNPCGDWYGFFSERSRTEIIQALKNLIVSKL